MNQPLPSLRLEWREAGAQDLDDIHALHLEATQGMASDLVRRDTREHFQAHLGKLGHIVACHAQGQGMLAYGVLALESSTVNQMAQLLGLSAKQRARFAVLDGASVAPQWRGLQLHQGLIRERVQLAQTYQRTLLAVTAAPGNLPSVRALLGSDFQVAGFAHLYQGDARLVLCRDLLARPQASAIGTRLVALPDHEGHQQALAAGLRGMRWVDHADGAHLYYAHCAMQALAPSSKSPETETDDLFP